MKLLSILVLAAVPLAAFAESNIVTIPGQGWHLVVDIPPLADSKGEAANGRFSYTGTSIESGITFSIHTEEMKDADNAQCRAEYWGKAQANPYIVKDSATLFETDSLHGVSYRSEGEYQGRAFTMVNAHGYFVENGKCVDLHVSQLPFSETGKAKVERIVRTSRVMK